MKLLHKASAWYFVGKSWVGPAVLSLFLLTMRLIWGYQFFIAGRGKLMDLSKPTAFFMDLHIPFPAANAWFVSHLECYGGLLLLVGLLSRPIAFLLTINMIVAYLTADNGAVMKLIQEGDSAKFFAAAPFWFLLTSVLVLAFGSGWFSIDNILRWTIFRPDRQCLTKTVASVPTLTPVSV